MKIPEQFNHLISKSGTILFNRFNKLELKDKIILIKHFLKNKTAKKFLINFFNISKEDENILNKIVLEIIENEKAFHILVSFNKNEGSTGVCQNNNCSNSVKFLGQKQGFNKYCSLQCSNTSEQVQLKKKQTQIKNFGKLYNQTDEYKKRTKRTKLERYGDENYVNREKMMQTIQKKTKEEIEESVRKIKQTKLERYGDENYNNKEKMMQTQMERFGAHYLKGKKIPHSHKRNHIKNIEDLNKEFLTELYKTKNIYECAEYFGITYSAMLKYLHDFDIKLKYQPSRLETEFSNMFPQFCKDRDVLDGLEIDFLYKNVGVEIDGLYWHSNKFKDKYYHVNKTENAEKKGVHLFHVFENEWTNTQKKHIWISMINNKLNKSKKVYARKCKIEEISSNEANTFLEENHLQGKINASIRIGLMFEGELISLMTFGKSRYNKNYEYELLRFATKKGYSVLGGGSKILKYFELNYKPDSLISYANRRWSQGNFYKTVGFKEISKTPPAYWTISGDNLIHRTNTQKHKLDTRPHETAFQAMDRMGILRIFDCGNLVFVKDYKGV